MFGSKKRQEAREAAQRISELQQFTEELANSDEAISEVNDKKFAQYLLDHSFVGPGGGTLELPEGVQRVYQLGRALAGRPIAAETSLIMKSGEFAYLSERVGLLKEITLREFKGGSKGISVPLGRKGYMRGVRVGTRSYRGHMETIGTEWQTADPGVLTVTNQRIVFTGGRKTLEFLFTKLATLNAFSDAIELGVTNRQNTSSFRVDDGEWLSQMIHLALNGPPGPTVGGAVGSTETTSMSDSKPSQRQIDYLRDLYEENDEEFKAPATMEAAHLEINRLTGEEDSQ